MSERVTWPETEWTGADPGRRGGFRSARLAAGRAVSALLCFGMRRCCGDPVRRVPEKVEDGRDRSIRPRRKVETIGARIALGLNQPVSEGVGDFADELPNGLGTSRQDPENLPRADVQADANQVVDGGRIGVAVVDAEADQHGDGIDRGRVRAQVCRARNAGFGFRQTVGPEEGNAGGKTVAEDRAWNHRPRSNPKVFASWTVAVGAPIGVTPFGRLSGDESSERDRFHVRGSPIGASLLESCANRSRLPRHGHELARSRACRPLRV